MKNGFFITMNMRMATGFETFGQFILGESDHFARSLFEKLHGTKEISDRDVLHLDLTHFRNDLPIDLTILNCSLEELTDNCRLISKELFRVNNLNEEDK